MLIEDSLSFNIDEMEYGVPLPAKISAVEYCPSELGVVSRYVDSRLLVDELVSSTKIFLAKDVINEKVSYTVTYFITNVYLSQSRLFMRLGNHS